MAYSYRASTRRKLEETNREIRMKKVLQAKKDGNDIIIVRAEESGEKPLFGIGVTFEGKGGVFIKLMKSELLHKMLQKVIMFRNERLGLPDPTIKQCAILDGDCCSLLFRNVNVPLLEYHIKLFLPPIATSTMQNNSNIYIHQLEVIWAEAKKTPLALIPEQVEKRIKDNNGEIAVSEHTQGGNTPHFVEEFDDDDIGYADEEEEEVSNNKTKEIKLSFAKTSEACCRLNLRVYPGGARLRCDPSFTASFVTLSTTPPTQATILPSEVFFRIGPFDQGYSQVLTKTGVIGWLQTIGITILCEVTRKQTKAKRRR